MTEEATRKVDKDKSARSRKPLEPVTKKYYRRGEWRNDTENLIHRVPNKHEKRQQDFAVLIRDMGLNGK